jgi:hypothetical protein
MNFDELYKHLLTLYTENINNIPRKELGMSTTILDLPDNKPYGFWVDRSGNFAEVPYLGHIKTLERIVNHAVKFFRKEGLEYGPKYRYNELLDLGWARVVTEGKFVLYEVQHVATPSQMKFFKILEETYDMQGIVRDV